MRNALLFVIMVSMAAVSFSCAKDTDEQKKQESGTASAGDPGYTHQLTLDTMRFQWKIDGKILRVKLKAPTTGWLGIGFNPTEGMKDAHFVMGFVKDGTATISDQHGTGKNVHKANVDLGGTSTVRDGTGIEKGNETEISFSVPLKSEEKLDSEIITDKDITVLLAYGKSDIWGLQHAFRAKIKLNLSTGQYTVQDIAKK